MSLKGLPGKLEAGNHSSGAETAVCVFVGGYEREWVDWGWTENL